MDKIDLYLATTKQKEVQTVCVFLRMYLWPNEIDGLVQDCSNSSVLAELYRHCAAVCLDNIN